MIKTNEVLKEKNQGPVWKRLSDADRQMYIKRDTEKFNGCFNVLPEVIYYEKGDLSYKLHLELLQKFQTLNASTLRISNVMNAVSRKDGSFVLYFGHNNARPSNENEFVEFIRNAVSYVNETLLTVGASKLISANKT